LGGNLVASVAACAVPERGDMRAATGPSRSVMAILLRWQPRAARSAGGRGTSPVL